MASELSPPPPTAPSTEQQRTYNPTNTTTPTKQQHRGGRGRGRGGGRGRGRGGRGRGRSQHGRGGGGRGMMAAGRGIPVGNTPKNKGRGGLNSGSTTSSSSSLRSLSPQPSQHSQTKQYPQQRRNRPDKSGLGRNTDQDVMIALAPLVRAQNPRAVEIHEKFMETNDIYTFVDEARALLQSPEEEQQPRQKELFRGDQESPRQPRTQRQKGKPINNRRKKQEALSPKPPLATSNFNSNTDSAGPERNKQDRNNNGQSQNSTNSPSMAFKELLQHSKQYDNTVGKNPNDALQQHANDEEEQLQQQQQLDMEKMVNDLDLGDDDDDDQNRTTQKIPKVALNSLPVTSVSPMRRSPPPPGFAPKQHQLTHTPPPGFGHRGLHNNDVTSQHQTNGSVRTVAELKQAAEPKAEPPAEAPTAVVSKVIHLPKRIMKNQPGTIIVLPTNNSHPPNNAIVLRPRQELMAQWSLPLSYLRNRVQNCPALLSKCKDPNTLSIRDAMSTLTVGLFRRGCAENYHLYPQQQSNNSHNNNNVLADSVLSSGVDDSTAVNKSNSNSSNSAQSQQTGISTSIISKTVTSFQTTVHQQSDTIYGTIPFYAPRTPGTLVFRLFLESDSVYTLATGPTMMVDVQGEDLEVSLRFVLSNLKMKKSGGNNNNNSGNTSGDKSGGGGSSLSSLNSLAWIFGNVRLTSPLPQQQQFRQNPDNRRAYNNHNNNTSFAYENAGRAAWGCLCESRKVFDSAHDEFQNKMQKVASTEEGIFQELNELKEAEAEIAEIGDENNGTPNDSDAPNVVNGDITENNDADYANKNSSTCDAVMKQQAKEVMAATINDGKDNSKDPTNENKNENGDKQSVKPKTKKKQLEKKLTQLFRERSNIERRWRDVQSSYSSILKAITQNANNVGHFLRRDQILKIRAEYELWCPFCESMAPFSSLSSSGGSPTKQDHNSNHPNQQQNNNRVDMKSLSESTLFAKRKLQFQTLGFLPAILTTSSLLSQSSTKRGHASPQAVLQALSSAMQTVHARELRPMRDFYILRESVRKWVEEIVLTKCIPLKVFPVGTTVEVFGSSANGFGSPNSDLDMCLQLPHVPPNANGSAGISMSKEDGRAAMSRLATELQNAKMANVDTNRLTARIPVIMFNFPLNRANDTDNDEHKPDSDGSSKPNFLQCDISLQNPLAVINTKLLRTYAHLSPKIQVLASIIKKWAKARKINDPSHHTLSSYGYTLMLLHFLLQHKDVILVPNLQYLNPNWKPGMEYQEVATKSGSNGRGGRPQMNMHHPTEPNVITNVYFYYPKDEATMRGLQQMVKSSTTVASTTAAAAGHANNHNNRIHPSSFPTPPAKQIHEESMERSLSVLLASFFRYYAMEFDYKKHVISLHCREGHVEKEQKAELDGWKCGSNQSNQNAPPGLSIEDPFETFYDVAHVIKTNSFHMIRKEFSLAYTKIVHACSPPPSPPNASPAASNSEKSIDEDNPLYYNTAKGVVDGFDLIQLICEPPAAPPVSPLVKRKPRSNSFAVNKDEDQ
eukprot:CAMPEP_0194365958 /NCGR_PEP_ID=MMETSP0174-20130528/13953_1 /TAXON_ID=216777 /ORGANISM="Proboscia alata, Strain PI-D3" /LENGTH=1515 /DNA_ID=CAMNT_0039140869 /DNA_START=344 /DNA_END=4891 /DNA_ORIENTATION=-